MSIFFAAVLIGMHFHSLGLFSAVGLLGYKFEELLERKK